MIRRDLLSFATLDIVAVLGEDGFETAEIKSLGTSTVRVNRATARTSSGYVTADPSRGSGETSQILVGPAEV